MRAGSGSYGKPAFGQVIFCVDNGECVVVENGSAERAISATRGQTFVDVLACSYVPRKNRSGAKLHDTISPRDHVRSRVHSPRMDDDVPRWRSVCHGAQGIEGDDDASVFDVKGGNDALYEHTARINPLSRLGQLLHER